ncbi:recQ-mediated genome instability protein 2-like [Eublepharis macularius]|uniref:RecQ-mediated genome instability protein 2 n=1 Tax=Eublepharis macularius TaxID=481883 RepID=A0AA97LG36_EUBMA|nr:recQ-mediated genome instability protein 2-like [Eublepharis macularius]XP_054854406.1 recQ-mediated genome instability protein 2-like [Eublepharis macularius]
MMSEGLNLQSPPVKVLAAQLQQCYRDCDGLWLLARKEYGRPALAVPLVWMQGTILTVDQDGKAVKMQDESGSFTVQGADKVPKGRPCLSAGKYVMVMGLVLSCSPEPILRAVKMTALTDSVLHRNMWGLEVEDLHRNLP